MANELKLGGVDELLAELIRLAPDLATEAGPLQASIAAETVLAIRAAYPSETGTLRASVQAERQTSASPVRVFTAVTVSAPYAHFVEFGTKDRAPNPAFVPLTIAGRQRFAEAVIARVQVHGLVVGGNT